MSRKNVWSAKKIRLELVKRNMTRVELAEEMKLSYSYVKYILLGTRKAEARRAQITEYFMGKKINELRGIS